MKADAPEALWLGGRQPPAPHGRLFRKYVLAFVLSGDETKTRAAGCDGYIAKPFSPRQLLAAVNGFLA